MIDTRRMWKSELERQVPGYDNAYYNEQNEVFCHDLKLGKRHTMSCDGYEASRDCPRKKYPVKAYGIQCPSYGKCPRQGGVWIPLKTDYRIFNPVDRSSNKFTREYKHRASVEPVNSRLDTSLGFEQHIIRGIRKMTMSCSLALILMLTLALGRVRQKQPDLLRSLIRTD